ncbi:MAG: Fic family protein, partial [Gammaproteobacteria bacterium]
PEVQTLLDGVTVGGHRLQDEMITLNLAHAWRFLFERVEQNAFALSQKFVCELHGILARQESLKWGEFRDGGVTIAGSEYVPPRADALPGLWRELEKKHQPALRDSAADIEALYTRAISVFLQMARTQFFYDANKRLGRLMMNGILLVNGLPAINLPAKRQLEFNRLMTDFYAGNNEQPMQDLMRDCIEAKVLEIMAE